MPVIDRAGLLMALSAVVLARGMLLLINDPEGPNLLVVAIAAVIVYVPTRVLYSRVFPKYVRSDIWRVVAAIVAQMIWVSVLYLLLR